VSGKAIGFIAHPGELETVRDGVAAATRLGFESWTIAQGAAEALEEHAAATALIVTVGGDGTFLLGARLGAPHNIPVLGVNRGRLGFLTDVELSDLPRAMEAFSKGTFELQRRSMLEVEIDGRKSLALNDVVVKAGEVSVARLHIEADGQPLGDFDADGLVIATATGSTAYALSAGGPLIDPRLRASVVVPLAAHAVVTRSLVLPDTTAFNLGVVRGEAVVAADGLAVGRLSSGQSVPVRPGPDAHVVRLEHSPSFATRIREKLHFGMPLKGAH
jgi:NAD+ kinase